MAAARFRVTRQANESYLTGCTQGSKASCARARRFFRLLILRQKSADALTGETIAVFFFLLNCHLNHLLA